MRFTLFFILNALFCSATFSSANANDEKIWVRPIHLSGYTSDGHLASVDQVTELSEYEAEPDYARYETSINAFLDAHPEPVPLFVSDELISGRIPAGEGKSKKFSQWVKELPAVQKRLKAGTVAVIQTVSKSRPIKAIRDNPVTRAVKNSYLPKTRGKIIQAVFSVTVGGLNTFAMLLMKYDESQLPFLRKALGALLDGLSQGYTTYYSDQLDRLYQYGGRYDPKNPVKVHPLKESLFRFMDTFVRTFIVLLPLEGAPDRPSVVDPKGIAWLANYSLDYTIVNYFSARTRDKFKNYYLQERGGPLLAPYQDSLRALRADPTAFEQTISRLAKMDLFENPFPELDAELRLIKDAHGASFATTDAYLDLFQKFESVVISHVSEKIKVSGGLTLFVIQGLLFSVTGQIYYFNAMPWILVNPSIYFLVTAGRATNWTLMMMFNLYYARHLDIALDHMEAIDSIGPRFKAGVERFRSFVNWKKTHTPTPAEVRKTNCEDAILHPPATEELYRRIIDAFSSTTTPKNAPNSP